MADTASISTSSALSIDYRSFQPVKSLHVKTKGISTISIPFRDVELEITVTNEDGTTAYTSTRQKWNSANTMLKDANGHQRIATSYFFGPGRGPRLRILGRGDLREIMSASRRTSRTQLFAMPDGREFEWRYSREKGCTGEGGSRRALTLTLEEKIQAMLVRNEETRIRLGSSRWSAGCGGKLVLGPNIGVKGGISEDVVVASCLLMLKKEIDRRRAVQALVVVAAIAAEA